MADLRALIVVLGDQLDLDAAAFDGFDTGRDAVWMAEVAEESTHVWSSKPRTVMLLAAMRHFALALQAAGRPLHYTRLDAAGNAGSLGARLQADILRLRPARLVMSAPGDWRVRKAIHAVAEANSLPLDIRADRHFFVTAREFAAHAKGRKTLTHGYANHIQRLMVIGLYALMLGVQPKQVHAWYLAVYVDTVEWVELPNTHGMSQYADGGVMGRKPYIATGRYIQRMSPH